MDRVLVIGLLLGLLLSVAGPIAADSRKRSAYILTNHVNNAIVSMDISSADGLLSSPSAIPTGGQGLQGVTAPGVRPPADASFGADSIIVGDNYLFAVNPGSNTLSMFLIDEKSPSHPTLIGAPADTLGDFPMAVAYSSELKIACTLNGGAIGSGVTCFSVDSATGLTPLDKSPRSIELHQTTPPTGVAETTSDILFNPSSTALIVLIKGNVSTYPPTPGYFYAWPVEYGQVSRTPVISRVSNLTMQFSGEFLGSDSRMLVTDVALGAAIVDISPSLEVTLETPIPITYLGATCWDTYSPKFDSVYITDGVRTNITIVDPKSGAIKGIVNLDAVQFGGYDSRVDRNWLYLLTFDTSVSVFDLRGDGSSGSLPCEVQTLNLTSFGPRAPWVGMAVYPCDQS